MRVSIPRPAIVHLADLLLMRILRDGYVLRCRFDKRGDKQ